MAEKYVNNALTTLNGAINNSVTALVVTSATGFPTTGNFRIIIDSEILLVTAVSGTTFTVTRGVESTIAASHLSSADVTHILTAAALSNIIDDKTALLPTGDLTYAIANCSADTSFTSGSWTDVTGCALSLGAGTWLITANIEFRNNSGGTTTGGCKIYYSSTDLIAGEYSLTNGFNAVFTLSIIAVLSGAQTVKLAGRDQSSNVCQAKQYGDTDIGAANIQGTVIHAVKIAS